MTTDTAAELRLQLVAARWWIDTLVDGFDIDPAETEVAVKVKDAAGSETTAATVTLADALAKMDAALAATAS